MNRWSAGSTGLAACGRALAIAALSGSPYNNFMTDSLTIAGGNSVPA